MDGGDNCCPRILLLIEYAEHEQISVLTAERERERERGGNENENNQSSSSSSSSSSHTSPSHSHTSLIPPPSLSHSHYHLPARGGHSHSGPGGHFLGSCLCTPTGCPRSNNFYPKRPSNQGNFFHSFMPCGGKYCTFEHNYVYAIVL